MKEQIEEMRDFMLKKSNSANVEPVFTTSEGQEIVLGKDLTKLLNDVLEQAFIPFLAEALYNAGFSKQEWISVEERLPDEGGSYLVVGKSGTPHIAHFYPEHKIPSTEFAIISAHFSNRYVRYWMPLPEAPTKGDE